MDVLSALESTGFPLWVKGPASAMLSLLLALGTVVIGIGVGEHLLCLLRIRTASKSERIVLAGGLGLGALSYSFFALGLIGWLRPWAVWAILALGAVGTWPMLRRWLARWREKWADLRVPGFFERLAMTLTAVVILIMLIRGLAPVTDYDGLAYHLVVPRDYLRAGRILSYPGVAHFNFPLAVNLLYLPPILLGVENAARLIHLGFGVLMGLGVYALADRLFESPRAPWLALFVLASTPLIGTVGGYAHIDLGWALFQFLAVYAVLCWQEERKRTWLVVAGLFAGLGLGSKYLGIPAWGVLGLVVLLQSVTRACNDGWLDLPAWKAAITGGLLFGLVALGVASPWYLKNWVNLGNPFYPLWFGGRAWDVYQTSNLQFMGSRYGPRTGILGVLLLPFDLFFHPIGHFGPTPFAFPPPTSLLLPLYLLVNRKRSVDWILFVVFVRLGTWAMSARNARYLLDIYPILSVAVAYLVVSLAHRYQVRPVLQGIVFVTLIASLVWQASLLMSENPAPVVLGLISREEYLVEHNDPPYGTIQSINELPPKSRTLFVGNGQSYYVTRDHVPDVAHGNWGHLVYLWGDAPEQIHHALVDQGFTHIYYSGYDFAWRLNFDAEGELARELQLFDYFVDHCAHLIFEGAGESRVYKLRAECGHG